MTPRFRVFPVGILALILGWYTGSPVLGITGASILGLAYTLTCVAATWLLPSSVEFGSLRTFRDLAEALSSIQA